jgi:hypothetical protein
MTCGRGLSVRVASLPRIFRRRWKPPRLKPWEGPFADPTQQLPEAPDVAAQRRAARQRWRAHQRAREAARDRLANWLPAADNHLLAIKP